MPTPIERDFEVYHELGEEMVNLSPYPDDVIRIASYREKVITAEQDKMRAFFEGAEYQYIDELLALGKEGYRELGKLTARRMKELVQAEREAEDRVINVSRLPDLDGEKSYTDGLGNIYVVKKEKS